MNVSYKVIDWLQTAFKEQADRINESYFFDKRDNEFYSVFITDYFLTDPDSTENFDSPYSNDELMVLSERLYRQENNDTSILLVPRLTIEERKEMLEMFLEQQNLQHKTELQNIVDAENGRTNLDFADLLSIEFKETWKEFKTEFIQKKIDSFCNLQNIDLETVTLWTDKKMTTMSLEVNDVSNKELLVNKPWWKFW